MENLKRFKTRFLLTMLMVFAGGNLFAATQTATIAVSNQIVATGGCTDATSGITVQVVGSGSAPSFAGSELTLPRGRQLLITSSHAMTGVTFSSYTSVNAGTGNAGAFTGNTFNGTFTGSTGTWASRSAFSNVGTIVLSVTGDEAEDAVKLSGNIVITYDDAVSTTKTTPAITVTPTEYTGDDAVLPNFDKLAEPAVVLTNGTANVTPYYQINYYINGQPTDGLTTNSHGAEITKDPVTGSEVERVYGQFLAGSKAGTVKVMIVAVPRNAYASQYEIVEGSYEVEIKKIKPQIGFEYNIPENGITLNVNQTIAQTQYSNTWQYQNSYEEHVALPKYTLDYVLPSGAKESALKYFDVTIEHLNTDRTPITVEDTDGKTYAVKMDRITPTTENKLTQDSITVSSTASTALVTGLSESDARSQAAASVVQGTNYVKYTFAPKAGYGDTYETPDPVEIPVTVGVIEGKIKLKLEGISTTKPDTIRLYKYNQDGLASKHPDALPIPTLKDQNNKELIVTGNPITYNYVIVKDSVYYDDCTNNIIQAASYEGNQQTGKLTGLQLQYTPGGTHLIQTGDAGLTKVIVFASVASWYTGYDNVFQMYDDEYPNMKDGYGNPISKIITRPDTFYVETLKRTPYVVIRDQEGTELTQLNVYKGQEITFNNMYDIAGRFDDEHNKATELGSAPEELEFASASNPNGFWYTFNVPAHLLQPSTPSDPTTAPMQILNWPTASQIDTLKYKSGELVGQDSIYLYHSDRGYGDAYRSWKIRFNADGDYPISYTIHAWNHVKWDTSSENTRTISFVVTDKKRTVLVIEPTEKFARTTDGNNFDEPIVKVMCGDEDVTDKFTITYDIKDGSSITGGTEGATGTQIVAADGTVTIGTRTGIEVVNVTATAKTDYSATYVDPAAGVYRIKITDDVFGYEIMNQCDNESAIIANPALLGKFHILSGSKLASGTTITGVPGLDITFGNFNEDVDWYVQETTVAHIGCGNASNTSNAFVINGGQVELNEEGLPTHGGYIVFSPYTNGYLTVDARWQTGATYRLICKTAEGKIWAEDYKPTSNVNGEYTFANALMVGNEYFLFDVTSGDLNFHGANFTPAYVVNRESDKETNATATIFMNGYHGDLPTLINGANSYVTFASKSDSYVTVGTDGTLTPVATTYKYNDNDNPENLKRFVTITATVTSSKTTSCSSLSKQTKLYVFVSDIPTYWTPDVADEDKEQPTAGTVVTTENIPTNIKMTFGGWKSGVTQHNTQTKGDAWTFKGKGNRVGGGDDDDDPQYNQYLDGFDCYISGDNNPKDEKGVQYTTYNYHRGSAYDYVENSKGSFTAPVTGTYLKFEPRESGTLFVYVVQNGACDKTNQNKATDNYKMKWRPLFIIDEKGQPVTMNDDFTAVKDFLSSGSDASTHLGSYTRGIIRSTVNDATIAAVVGENKHAISGMNKTADCVYDWSEFKGTAHDADQLIEVWKGKAVGDRQDLIRLDNGGYTLVHKAYVRYTFNVKAGKTYFVLQGGSKLEFGGFSFVPNGFPEAGDYNQENGKTQADLPIQTYDQFTTEVDDCDYTVKNHTYTAGKWSSICLPFSVQESQVKEIFGDDVMLLTCDSVMTKTPGKTNYLHFTQHAYRMIEAGRPYLIKPSEMSSTLYNNGSTTFKHVSIEMTTDGKAVDPSIYNVSLLGGEYVFKGLYKGENMPAYSYFAAADGLYRYATDYADPDGSKMSYRAYIRTDKGQEALARSFNMSYDDALDRIDASEGITTGILSIDSNGEMDVHTDDRIFNLQGVYVGRGAELLQTLPQGIYIIGGRKHVVK